ncbi:sigma-54 interaction domain-containing protein [Desulforamulus ferrireducens]|uniref:HTH-type transcriptional regulatory protein TyrR n=1 Tax=Desulforamulus ferrireducens TaxID=1833852 RepID=A0A1S6ISZ0_9FIRM|nr:sigma 54-interacting transcriptional regulator [Desulforamulus ferrireducens]AQS57884.1 hypothetical protein B0537_01445 [Desulforamulus ferrireducens]
MPDDITTFFDRILDVFSDGIYISDRFGKTIKVNDMYEKLTGLKKENLLGRYVKELETEGVYDIAINPLVVKTGKPQTSLQNTSTGRKVILNGHPVFDHNGEVAYVITFVRDVTVLSQLKEQVSYQAELIEKYHREARYLRTRNHTNTIIENPKMRNLMELLKRIAVTDSTVLILGDTGVGKDVFATHIHQYSLRRDEPFFKINCATIPESLIESELFGYEPGAFSGASTKGKPGYFEMADKGTLFLDEIGELPLPMQAKLLRVLQDQEVMRIGSTKVKKVDVRFIAATNRNLEESVQKGTFRSDLYYRLRVAVLELPPLRERKEEIIPFIDFFLDKFNTKYRKKIDFSPEVKKLLQEYRWPGNVREMENLIQGLVVTQDKAMIEIEDLPNYLLNNKEMQEKLQLANVINTEEQSLGEIMEGFEKSVLEKALASHKSVAKVAKALKVDRSTIFRKLKKYGIIQ